MIFNHPSAFALSNPRPASTHGRPTPRVPGGGSEGATWSPHLLPSSTSSSPVASPTLLPSLTSHTSVSSSPRPHRSLALTRRDSAYSSSTNLHSAYPANLQAMPSPPHSPSTFSLEAASVTATSTYSHESRSRSANRNSGHCSSGIDFGASAGYNPARWSSPPASPTAPTSGYCPVALTLHQVCPTRARQGHDRSVRP